MFKNILSIILLGTAAAVFFVFSKPLYQEIQDLRVHRESLNDTLSQSKKIQAKRDEILSQYNNISNDNLDRLKKMLPNSPDSIKFILGLDNISRKNGIILKDINVNSSAVPSSGGQKIDVISMPISMKVSASYVSFYNFLKDIENNLRLTEIKEINFTAGDADFYEFKLVD
ncbi:MAG: hypothetical protein Athens071424_213 [Parcubacteria group bacterium Athens0714_24]|nr:MAG: hypothetical protein Athens071424_213 [Parcubacteria group bacterium Athens0714_24]